MPGSRSRPMSRTISRSLVERVARRSAAPAGTSRSRVIMAAAPESRASASARRASGMHSVASSATLRPPSSLGDAVHRAAPERVGSRPVGPRRRHRLAEPIERTAEQEVGKAVLRVEVDRLAQHHQSIGIPAEVGERQRPAGSAPRAHSGVAATTSAAMSAASSYRPAAIADAPRRAGRRRSAGTGAGRAAAAVGAGDGRGAGIAVVCARAGRRPVDGDRPGRPKLAPRYDGRGSTERRGRRPGFASSRR